MSMTASSPQSLILTLKLDSASLALFNQLRQQHFPRHRNFLPAHVTLFHVLPAEQEEQICQILYKQCASTPVLPLQFPQICFLGRGVAIEVDCPELVCLRSQLAETWNDWLTAQDRQSYRPHITIQNKQSPDVARQLYEQLSKEWHMMSGRAEGLLLWRYQGGPWKAVAEFTFQAK
jgi:2'-5' RNA ligase